MTNVSGVGRDLENRLRSELSEAVTSTNPVRCVKVRLGNPSQPQLHVEVLSCGVEVSPVHSYAMAVSAKRLLGGFSLRWSATVDPIPHNADLHEYFVVMGNISERKDLVVNEKSMHAEAAIWQIENRTRFILNNVVMSDSEDEHIYHELLVHPALLAAGVPQQVLVIGGGEGAALREVLKHPLVENVTMVDIDEGLIAMCRKHLGVMHKGSFSSSKMKLVFSDGATFLASVPPRSYDAIIVDGIDFREDGDASCEGAPSYGNSLFTGAFYEDAFRSLRDKGVLVQYMSSFDKKDHIESTEEAGFSRSLRMCVDIDSFFGAGACFALAAKGIEEALATRIYRRMEEEIEISKKWKYLSLSTMTQSTEHQARRLKGSDDGSSGGGGGGGPVVIVAMIMIPLTVLGCVFLFVMWLSKK